MRLNFSYAVALGALSQSYSCSAFTLHHRHRPGPALVGSSLRSATLNEDVTKTLDLEYQPISPFGKGQVIPTATTETAGNSKAILGGKGANLAEMTTIGLAVPPGFTITTECCDKFCNEWNYALPDSLWQTIRDSLRPVEEALGKQFGNADNPLLLSVRSGAAVSMPGMMDTVLNLGMNDAVCRGLAQTNPRFAWDSYRRFLEMFGNVVLELPRSAFEEEMDDVKYDRGVLEDSELSVEDLQEIVERFKQVYVKNNLEFPTDVYAQLRLAVSAVFRGWMGARAVKYREVEDIRGLLGTAVNVQAMVFGNMGDTSGTGVCFTRDPNNGTNELFGEYLIDAQGEDVVAGIRTPLKISTLEENMKTVYDEFQKNTDILEKHYGDMQDVEFTIQEGELFMLQTRTGKRGGEAAVKIAVDLVKDGFITKEEAIQKVTPDHLDQLLHPRFSDVESDSYKTSVLAQGLPASPGAAVGRLAFTNDKVVEYEKEGIPAILIRDETSPDDVEGMFSSQGILTARGGMTSHAAVVARGWGRPCICGCTALSIDEEAARVTMTLADGTTTTFAEGDYLSLNGNTGEVLRGEQTMAPPAITGDLKSFMEWVDEIRDLGVLANADTPEDAAEARRQGAEGIGLCRTEHMFFDPRRIRVVRRLILGNKEQSDAALQELLVYQREDFEGIFQVMDGVPVTVRLLDPPLHEFLPSVEDDEILTELATDLGQTTDALRDQVKASAEVNPMLGLRGCRLGITRPAIIEMQVRAVIEAVLNASERGIDAKADIMVPLVGKIQEFRNQAALIRQVADQVFEERGKKCDYRVGTMIEIPRAALTAHEIAKEADFFSFGSNDLTQMTFGYSRDDVGSFVPTYLSQDILQDDPFVTLDTEGVGKLIEMTVAAGKTEDPTLKIGVCGEHGGDPRSVRFFHQTGLSYVSCSPFRVPIARLAAAQASVESKQQ